jgi:hypothetical protein
VAERVLFAEPAHVAVLRRMHLIGAGDRSAFNRRIVITLVVGWLPLFVINLIRVANGDAASWWFFQDIGANARLLLAVPLLIAAEYVTLPRLEMLVAYMRDSVIAHEDIARFDESAARAWKSSAGVLSSAILLIATYAASIALVLFAPHDEVPPWRLSTTTYFSPAGWWHALVGIPLFVGLIFGWLWRLAIWMRFLHAVSRMRLRLIAAHPDRAAGLQFLAYTPRYFALIALAIGISMAGTLANGVLQMGIQPVDHALVPVVTAAIITVIIVSPPLVFSPALRRTWQEGILRYSDLARRVGRQFERKWFDAASTVDPATLGEPDFSSTTDLYSIAAYTYDMRLFVLDYRSVAMIAIASLVPFVPIWLTAIPIDKVLKTIAGALL